MQSIVKMLLMKDDVQDRTITSFAVNLTLKRKKN